jgi:Phage integrase family
MRRGELLGLTWRAVDLQGARLTVDQQLTPRLELAPPKSERSRRTVALDPETVAALRSHRDTQLLERDFAGDSYDDRDLVFCDEFGGPIHPRRLGEHFHRHREAAGIRTGTQHVLRHTAATLALSNGVAVHIVAARLRDRPEQILSTCAHLLPQSDELAAERVAAVIRSWAFRERPDLKRLQTGRFAPNFRLGARSPRCRSRASRRRGRSASCADGRRRAPAARGRRGCRRSPPGRARPGP